VELTQYLSPAPAVVNMHTKCRSRYTSPQLGGVCSFATLHIHQAYKHTQPIFWLALHQQTPCEREQKSVSTAGDRL